MWGIFPIGSSILAILVVLIPGYKEDGGSEDRPYATEENIVPGSVVL